MTIAGRNVSALSASGALIASLFYAAGLTYASQVPHQVMLVNAKTGKCVTIAGGTLQDNNIRAVQFDCDSDASRRWGLNLMNGRNIYQIRNVKTGKCLTIEGGTLSNDNLRAVQFDCDNDQSRAWEIADVTGSGVYQIRNVKTGKCLTIAGGTLPDNNIEAVQFSCDGDQSRHWTIRLKL
jgi:cytolethal distending toxin subunit A